MYRSSVGDRLRVEVKHRRPAPNQYTCEIFREHDVLPVEAVAIYQMIKTASYSPEDIERLTAAYDDALRLLQLANRTDPISEIVAKRIIDAAKTGIRDPEELCAWAIKDLMIPNDSTTNIAAPRRTRTPQILNFSGKAARKWSWLMIVSLLMTGSLALILTRRFKIKPRAPTVPADAFSVFHAPKIKRRN